MKTAGYIDMSARVGAASCAERGGARIVFGVFGFVGVVALSMSTDLVLYATGALPKFGQPMFNALFLLSLGYRLLFCTVCSSLGKRCVVPGKPSRTVSVFCAAGLAASMVVQLVIWDGGPVWYPLALIALMLPYAVTRGDDHVSDD